MHYINAFALVGFICSKQKDVWTVILRDNTVKIEEIGRMNSFTENKSNGVDVTPSRPPSDSFAVC